MGNEDWVGGALEAGPDGCSEILVLLAQLHVDMECCTYIDWANEILVSHKHVRHSDAEENSQDPGTNKAFNRFLRGEFYELRSSKCDAADVGKNVVSDDKADRQEEPDHPLEHIVHDEVRLNHNKH